MTTSSSQDLSPAYVLHARKYRDTSLIVELFTERDGRVAAVHRGARGKKQTTTVQPFTPALVAYSGKGELKTLTKIDAGSMQPVTGDRLLLGMYANELLVKLLGKDEPAKALFDGYQKLLLSLISEDDCQVALRRFELKLLEELGYGISFAFEAVSGDMVSPNQHYRFVADEGFHPIATETPASYSGRCLLAIADNEFDEPEIERTARRITRIAIGQLLGGRPLQSRELYRQLAQGRQQ